MKGFNLHVTKLVKTLDAVPMLENARYDSLLLHSASLSQSSHSSSSDVAVRCSRFDYHVEGHSVEPTQLNLFVSLDDFSTRDAAVGSVTHTMYSYCY